MPVEPLTITQPSALLTPPFIFSGCSGLTCSNLYSSFPHITDCLKCWTNNCNRRSCIQGRLVQGFGRKQNDKKQVIKAKNTTRYKHLWPDTADYDVERERVIKYGPLGTKYNKPETIMKTSRPTMHTPRPTTTTLSTTTTITHVTTTTVTTTTLKITFTTSTEALNTTSTALGNVTVGAPGAPEAPIIIGDVGNGHKLDLNFDNLNTFEKIVIGLLLLTLLSICCYLWCWLQLCSKSCCCNNEPRRTASMICDIVEDDKLEIRIRHPSKIQNRITVKKEYEDECSRRDFIGDSDTFCCGRVETEENILPNSKTEFDDAIVTKYPPSRGDNNAGTSCRDRIMRLYDAMNNDPNLNDGLVARISKCVMFPALLIQGLSQSFSRNTHHRANVRSRGIEERGESSSLRHPSHSSGTSTPVHPPSTSYKSNRSRSTHFPDKDPDEDYDMRGRYNHQ